MISASPSLAQSDKAGSLANDSSGDAVKSVARPAPADGAMHVAPPTASLGEAVDAAVPLTARVDEAARRRAADRLLGRSGRRRRAADRSRGRGRASCAAGRLLGRSRRCRPTADPRGRGCASCAAGRPTGRTPGSCTYAHSPGWSGASCPHARGLGPTLETSTSHSVLQIHGNEGRRDASSPQETRSKCGRGSKYGRGSTSVGCAMIFAQSISRFLAKRTQTGPCRTPVDRRPGPWLARFGGATGVHFARALAFRRSRRRTPGPPPFSSMNTTPAPSSALRIAPPTAHLAGAMEDRSGFSFRLCRTGAG